MAASRLTKSSPKTKTKTKTKTAKSKAKTAKTKTAKAKTTKTKTRTAKTRRAATKPQTKRAERAPGVAKKSPREPKPSLARQARQAHAMKKVIADVITPVESGSRVVDAYLRDIDHPFKAEMEALRAAILAASPKLSERIKWNAPSFYYKEDLGAFNPRATEYAHLILLFPGGIGMPQKSPLLEGQAKDRREAKFHSLADVEAKKPALQRLIKAWVKLRDA